MQLIGVELTGFLSVKQRLEVRIDPRVTVLLGPNDHGKSNLLTALSRLATGHTLPASDRNWDLRPDREARVAYNLSLSAADRRRVVERVKATLGDAGPKVRESDVPHEVVVWKSESIGLTLDSVKIPEVGPPILDLLPAVEMFEPIDSIQDSATADVISGEEHEFMQGIFLYAGISQSEWPSIFVQGDKTLMRLEKASATLNKTLRKDWSQGQNLTFRLTHNSATASIELYIKDPSVSTRWMRASEKSSGFTHYFALRTRMFARSGGHPDGSYVWLFDEPGVWLHPAGQFDLMQAIEAIAQRNQVVYSTHSIFMINRNFPARHRLIVKTPRGTQLDAKPYASRWTAALDALGFSLGGSLLFAPCVLLTEGDSDPILIYTTLQRLAGAEAFEKDINSLGILAAGDARNGEAIARLLLQGANKPRVAILSDGDHGGRQRARARMAQDAETTRLVLPEGTETEDYIPNKPAYVRAVAVTAAAAAGRNLTDEDVASLLESLGDLNEPMLGRRASDAARQVFDLEDAPSKLVAASIWAEEAAAELSPDEIEGGRRLAEVIDQALELPNRTSEERRI